MTTSDDFGVVFSRPIQTDTVRASGAAHSMSVCQWCTAPGSRSSRLPPQRITWPPSSSETTSRISGRDAKS